jgi:hypothetical protein
LRQVLLELQILIRSYEDVEPVSGCASQQLAVSQSGPALVLHGTDFMADELPGQPSR